MFSENGDVCVSHPRVPWRRFGATSTRVHAELGLVKGTHPSFDEKQQRVLQAAYKAAKENNDVEAAFDIVERCVWGETLDRIVDAIPPIGRPILLIPHPPFDDEDAVGRQVPIKDRVTNALPFAYAHYLGEVLGADVDGEILQQARVGRTQLTTFMRFLCQPSFIGPISTARPYILVDDTVSTGGTFAALRSYVVAGGGTVIATTALASRDGRDTQFEIAEGTHSMLLSVYGHGVVDFWQRTFGHGTQCLTEIETQRLVDWGLAEQATSGCSAGDQTLQRLRARINQAASKGK